MRLEEFTEFTKGMAALSTMFDKELTKPFLDAYFSALSDLSLEQFRHAVNTLARSSKFFPKPAEFYEAAQGTVEDKAERAWMLLLDCVERHGVTDSLATDDAALSQSINEAFGGWIRCGEVLHDATEPMLASYGKQFKACYRLALKQPKADAPLYLVGQAEASNRQNSALWAARLLAQGCTSYGQRVAIIAGGKLFSRSMEFAATTGALTDESRNLLAPASLQRLALQPAKPARPVLVAAPAASDPSVEHGEELIAEWQRRFNPTGRLSIAQVISLGLGVKALPEPELEEVSF